MTNIRRSFPIAVFCFLILGCQFSTRPAQPNSSTRYDLDNPFIIKLPETLIEISGIAYYAKDTSVFAIEDEHGYFFKISLNDPNKRVEKWRFDKKHDYEDVVLHDSVFYVLISNGSIEALRFGNDGNVNTQVTDFPDVGKKNEFESLYYDDSLKQLVLLCKECEDDKARELTAWSYDINTQTYTPSVFKIDIQQIAEKLGKKKIRLKPSAMALNPVTNEFYIISAIDHLLVVTDRQGKLKELYTLDPKLYKQPEGMAFTPAGDLIISNEYHETGAATILILKNKKKGL